MSDPRYELVRACFKDMKEIFPAGGPRDRMVGSRVDYGHPLPQMPQMPQAQTLQSKRLSLEADRFEERAAIIQHDGKLPRALAEFLAARPREP